MNNILVRMVENFCCLTHLDYPEDIINKVSKWILELNQHYVIFFKHKHKELWFGTFFNLMDGVYENTFYWNIPNTLFSIDRVNQFYEIKYRDDTYVKDGINLREFEQFFDVKTIESHLSQLCAELTLLKSPVFWKTASIPFLLEYRMECLKENGYVFDKTYNNTINQVLIMVIMLKLYKLSLQDLFS